MNQSVSAKTEKVGFKWGWIFLVWGGWGGEDKKWEGHGTEHIGG